MKKVVIISDTHFQTKYITAVNKLHSDADLFIHCGDSQLEVTHPELAGYVKVKGNNDFGDYPKFAVADLGNERFFVTHGHLYNIEFGPDVVVQAARDQGATIACYGHTHVPVAEVVNGVLCINPGSTSFPRGKVRVGSYAILYLNDDGSRVVRFYNSNDHSDITDELL